MKVLILDNYDSFTYNLFHYCKLYTDEVDVFRNDEISIAQIDAYSHIVLSPGPGLPKDAGILMDCIEEYKSSKKILGVCLGLQAIAENFGGSLYNQQKVKHGIQEEINLLQTESGIFKGLEQKCNVGLYHSWAVSKNDLPDCFQVTAISDSNVIMAVEHSYLKISGVQFHPESIMTDFGKEMIENWLIN